MATTKKKFTPNSNVNDEISSSQATALQPHKTTDVASNKGGEQSNKGGEHKPYKPPTLAPLKQLKKIKLGGFS